MATTNTYFHCDYQQLLERLDQINPKQYIRNRNYLDGDVTQLSPFITHGVLSTRDIAKSALNKTSSKQPVSSFEKFFFQLAWRDFFHRVWQDKSCEIFDNLTHSQLDYGCIRGQMPKAIVDASTGITVLDETLKTLYKTGYIHNHARMWLAFVVANLAHTDWRIGAKWMHYHLLDGDLASNTLSWQWVAGTFSNKQYIANQDNLNKYSVNEVSQKDTFLDVSYEQLSRLETPKKLIPRSDFYFQDVDFDKIMLDLNASQEIDYLNKSKNGNKLFLRNMNHLDPLWHAGEKGQHVVLIEPNWVNSFSLSDNRWAFIQHWIEQIRLMNKELVQIVIANFNDIAKAIPQDMEVVYQHHNQCEHWKVCLEATEGLTTVEDYPWLFPGLEGSYSSFFSYWKQAKKQLNSQEWLDLIKMGQADNIIENRVKDHAA